MDEEIKNTENNENINQKKHYKLKKEYIKRTVLIIIGLILCLYVGGYFFYDDKFLSNTTVNDFDVSNMSLKSVHSMLEKQIQNHSITLTFIDNQTEVINQEDSGISYNQNNQLENILNQQNHWLWFTNFFKKEKLVLEDIVTVDDNKLTTTVNSLKHMAEDQQVAPVDAKVVYENKEFSIVEEKNGSTLKSDQLKNMIQNAFTKGAKEINVLDNDGYVLPKVKSTDKQLNNLLEASKEHANASITYQTTSGNVVLDGNTLQTWLSIDEEGNYYRDEENFKKQAKSFVKELAKKIDNIGDRKTYTLAYNRQVSVSGGNYGLKLNQTKEVEGLLEDISNHKKGTRTPVTSGVQASYSNNGLGNTFVEVDLTNQKVYLVKNGNVVMSSDCVTGKYTDADRRTPAGTYYLYMKQRDRILRGTRLPDGTWPYESPVSYWMPFNKGIGLHDASWRNEFGGDIYINKGSHGCINLPTSFAAQLYNSIKVKIPVVCHY